MKIFLWVLLAVTASLLSFKLYTSQSADPKFTQPALPQLEEMHESEDTPTIQDSANYINAYITFYGWVDNDPSGRSIAYPNGRFPLSLHSEASGTGTYDDPITFASDPDAWAIGTILYVPYLKKYIIMEDWCSQCVINWQEHKKHHIDIWMESGQQFKDEVLECENYWTKKSASVEINPLPDREVDTTSLFDKSKGECFSGY